jgi:hypothetical protein
MTPHPPVIAGLLLLVGLLGSSCGPLGTPLTPLGYAPRVCRTNADCCARELCEKEWGDCRGIGKCEEKPQLIGANLDIICGCDGHTYSSRWIAYKHGVAVAHGGECPGEPWPPYRQ